MSILLDLDALQRQPEACSIDAFMTLLDHLCAVVGKENLVLAVNEARADALSLAETLEKHLESRRGIHLYNLPLLSNAVDGLALRHLDYTASGADVVVRGITCSELSDAALVGREREQHRYKEILVIGHDDMALSEHRLKALIEGADHCIDIGGRHAWLADRDIAVGKYIGYVPGDDDLDGVIESLLGHPGSISRQHDTADMTEVPTPPGGRPALALVSPLPPAKTGIANYTAELLGPLAQFYRLTLVTDQAESVDDALAAEFEVLNSEEFRDRAHSFDRVLYHIGNSPFHDYMFQLMEERPGSVVLHDIFIADAYRWLHYEKWQRPVGFTEAIHHSHGYPGVMLEASNSPGKLLSQLPISRRPVELARGLIVHSHHAHQLLQQWYGSLPDRDTFEIPHLRVLPTLRQSDDIRQRLGVRHGDLVIATFGGITPSKCPLDLLEAFLSTDLAERSDVTLLYVGNLPDAHELKAFEQRLKNPGCSATIRVTGYIDNATYADYLQCIDIAVQLRNGSRGETSGAALDVMAHAVPLIANAQGALAELPAQAVRLIEEQISTKELAQALSDLAGSPDDRKRLGQAARDYIHSERDPAAIAVRYHQAIESGYRCGQWSAYDDCLARLGSTVAADDTDTQRHIARALSDNRPVVGPPRLFLDMTALTITDLKTGIERVTRKLAWYMLHEPPANMRVEPIRWDDRGRFLHARAFTGQLLGLSLPPAPDRPIDPRPGDVYLSLEWSPPVLEKAQDTFRHMRLRGVDIHFIVFDLLPLGMPQHFPAEVEGPARRWFESICTFADGLHCISEAVADDVRTRIDARPVCWRTPKIDAFPLGADLGGSVASTGLRAEDREVLERLSTNARQPVLLMVGTLEPRKGHRLVLDALDRLWSRGESVQLVIAGKQGWKMDELAARLRKHRLAGRSLHWIEGASDEMIERLYRQATALVAASEGEGFGLPIIEAARHGVPVIARDIPVFREVGGELASYFPVGEPAALSQWLADWLHAEERHAVPESIEIPTWQQSAQTLLERVLGQAAIKVDNSERAEPRSAGNTQRETS